ncbi:MAG: carbohydrate kinase family protein [Deltaproteobacteria bacterium]|nr:carbohydrate kinase family protein [Deltaproteobacteria bacterium]
MKRLQLATTHSPFGESNVTVIGQVTHDRYDQLYPGGCAYYAAIALKGLGANVSLVSSVGQDFLFARHLEGLRCIMRIGDKTTEFCNVYPSVGPRIQYVQNCAPNITDELLPQGWRSADLCILAPVMGELNEVVWSKIRGARHTAIFLQGYLKKAHTQVRNGRRLVVPFDGEFNWEMVRDVDSAFLSREDIELFASTEFLRKLTTRVRTVAVTDGERGCRIYHEDTLVDVDIFPVDAVDSTGAGDTFGAATAMALAHGYPIESAARLGSAAASVVVEGVGGTRLDRIKYAFERQHCIFAKTSSNSHSLAV